MNNFDLQNEVPETLVTGQTADISPIAELSWYDWVKFWDTNAQFPENKEVYGRWLGPAIDIGPAMSSKILKENGQYVVRSTYRPLSHEETEAPAEKAIRDTFDVKITEMLGKSTTTEDLRELDPDTVTPEFQPYSDDFEGTRENVPDIDEVTPEQWDNYIGAEVMLPCQGTSQSGKVKSRARDDSGQLYGTKNENPILDTRD